MSSVAKHRHTRDRPALQWTFPSIALLALVAGVTVQPVLAGPTLPCTQYAGSLYFELQFPPCLACGTPVISTFSLQDSEAYVVQGTAGSEYVFDFCSGHDPFLWEPQIAVGYYDGSGGLDGPPFQGANDCSITFFAPITTTYIVVVSELNNCGGSILLVDGTPFIDCGPMGATCVGAPDPPLLAPLDGNLTDISGNGHDGVDSGGSTFTQGILDEALELDGVDDTVTFPTIPDPYLGLTDFTIAFYFHLDSAAGQQSLVSKRNVCNSGQFIDVRTMGSSVRFEVNGGTTAVVPSAPFSASTWHHFAGVREGSDLRLYLDGVLEQQLALPNLANVENSTDFGIGTSPCVGVDGTVLPTGAMDDLRVYGRALGQSEIRDLVSVFRDGFESGDTTEWSSTSP